MTRNTTTSKKRPLTDAERAEKRAADRELSLSAIAELRDSTGWKAWLRTRGRLTGNYSISNQLLIALQHPTATHVATFKNWLALGYCVRKGEKGFRIWQGMPPSKAKLDAWRAAGAIPEQRPRTYFRLFAVFAQDQVDPLPPPADPQPLELPERELEGDDLAPTLPRLIAAAEAIGSSVTFAAGSTFEGHAQGAAGYYEIATKRIVIDNEHPINSQAATLVHELAHALVRADRQPEDPKLTYAREELVVESVAYTVIRGLGIDADDKSIPYLAFWSEITDNSVIKLTADLIDRLARHIEDAISTPDEDADQDRVDDDTEGVETGELLHAA